MQRQKKQLLGIGSVALAGILTASAFAMPTPKVAAMSSAQVPVTVVVESQGEVPVVNIDSPVNGSNIVNNQLKIKLNYSKADRLTVKLTDKNGNVINVDTSACPKNLSNAAVTCELTTTLPAISTGDMKYTMDVVASNSETGSTSSNSVSFTQYVAFLDEFGGTYVSTTGDPVMSAMLNDLVDKVVIKAVNADGTEAFSPAYEMTKNVHFGQKNAEGRLLFALPLWEHEAPAGTYRVEMKAYAADGREISVGGSPRSNVVYTITNTTTPPKPPQDPNIPGGPNNPNVNPPTPPRPPYNPDNPDDPDNPDNPDDPNNPGGDKPGDSDKPTTPPDTGLNLFSDLNISSADYIVTGLVAFGLVTAFAVFLIIRRSRR